MGCHQSSSSTTTKPQVVTLDQQFIKVLTLNYCGILKSPFQFYSGQYTSLHYALGKTFLKLMPEYIQPNQRGQYEWTFAQVDKIMGNRRQSPVFKLQALIVSNKNGLRFRSKDDYKTHWQQKYTEAINDLKIPLDETKKKQAFQFDLLVLHTLLANVYENISSIDDAQSMKPQAYINKYKPLFQQSFLNEQKKCVDLILKINNYDFDIFFVQEGSDRLIENLAFIEAFHVQVSSDRNTLIVINKLKFKSCRSAMSMLADDERKKLNWNGHTSIAIADNYILINCHLSSKPKVNEENMKQMKSALVDLKNKFPDYEIICGGDANSYVSSFDNSFHIFPQNQSQFTSLKKRSFLQVQFRKSEKIVKTAKDHIISTLEISKGEIVTIQGQIPTEQTFLPSNEHPFDHFLVKVDLIKQDPQ